MNAIFFDTEGSNDKKISEIYAKATKNFDVVHSALAEEFDNALRCLIQATQSYVAYAENAKKTCDTFLQEAEKEFAETMKEKGSKSKCELLGHVNQRDKDVIFQESEKPNVKDIEVYEGGYTHNLDDDCNTISKVTEKNHVDMPKLTKENRSCSLSPNTPQALKSKHHSEKKDEMFVGGLKRFVPKSILPNTVNSKKTKKRICKHGCRKKSRDVQKAARKAHCGGEKSPNRSNGPTSTANMKKNRNEGESFPSGDHNELLNDYIETRSRSKKCAISSKNFNILKASNRIKNIMRKCKFCNYTTSKANNRCMRSLKQHFESVHPNVEYVYTKCVDIVRS